MNITKQEFDTLPALNAAMKAAGIYNPSRHATQGHWIFTGPDGTQYARCKFPQTGWFVCAIEETLIRVTRKSGIGKNQDAYLRDIPMASPVWSIALEPRHAMTFTPNQAKDVAAWLRTTAAGSLYQIEVI